MSLASSTKLPSSLSAWLGQPHDATTDHGSRVIEVLQRLDVAPAVGGAHRFLAVVAELAAASSPRADLRAGAMKTAMYRRLISEASCTAMLLLLIGASSAGSAGPRDHLWQFQPLHTISRLIDAIGAAASCALQGKLHPGKKVAGGAHRGRHHAAAHQPPSSCVGKWSRTFSISPSPRGASMR